MDKRLLGIGAGITVVIAIIGVVMITSNSETIVTQETNEKVGLVINSPNQSVSLQQLDEIFSVASSTGIGRTNAYLFWNVIEPERGEFDWSQSDILMGLNAKNNLKVTLFFSVINGKTLGPFPDWIGKPSINAIGEERLVTVLDSILSRYHIIDTVIIAGETESHFRYAEQNIPVYQNLFSEVYTKLKEKHPDVKFGNSFALHHVLNKDLDHIVEELSMGDFVAFSYSPVDSLNDIVNTPQKAGENLQNIFKIAPNKKIGIFEISWSTSDFVGGDADSQKEFLEYLFEFYSENESEIEFLTWYRLYDKPENTCTVTQEIGNEKIDIGGDSSLGSSEHVIERLNHYVCSAGLVDVDGKGKPGWHEFKNQIEMIS